MVHFCGADPGQIRKAAKLRSVTFRRTAPGSVVQHQQESCETHTLVFVETVWQNFRNGARRRTKRPEANRLSGALVK